MNQQTLYTDTRLDKAMNPDQFVQIVEAILAGKYTWACILFLRFAGYNPLYYIPSRTYYRLVKEDLGNQPNISINKTVPSEQLNQLITAIIDGKYSWACILFLRFAGHNPRYYIPRRTYCRLVKENLDNQCSGARSKEIPPWKCSGKITDLGYLEVVSEQDVQVQGGSLNLRLDRKTLGYYSINNLSVAQAIF